MILGGMQTISSSPQPPPRFPGRRQNLMTKLPYNRLSMSGSLGSTSCRSDSFKNRCVLPRVEDQIEIKMPPAYTDIYTPGPDASDSSSLGSPPAYYSNTPSVEDTKPASQEVCVEVAAAGPVPPVAPAKKS